MERWEAGREAGRWLIQRAVRGSRPTKTRRGYNVESNWMDVDVNVSGTKSNEVMEESREGKE